MAVYRMTPEITSPADGYWGDGLLQAHSNGERQQKQRTEAALRALENGQLPDLKGWPVSEAIALLESHGYTVKLRGNGRVKKASKQNKTVELDLG